jgi:hypothetical protein
LAHPLAAESDELRERRTAAWNAAAVSEDRNNSVHAMRARIMYVENKSDGLTGPARIGRVSFSRTGRTLYYRGRSFRSLKGAGFKSNYYDVGTGDEYWISGPRKDGGDRLYGERSAVEIDDDVREEYWTQIRRLPGRAGETIANR